MLLIGQLGLGGTEGQLVLLAGGLRSRGLDVHVVTLRGEGPRQRDLMDAGIPVWDAGFQGLRNGRPGLHAIGSGLLALLSNVAAFWRLVRFFRRTRPQVVHAFLYHAYVITPLAARLASVPLVVAGRRSMSDFKEGRRLLLAVERLATAMTDVIVANAEAVAGDVFRHEWTSPSKVVVIRNGLPPAAFDLPDPAPLTTDVPVVLCVANLIAYKGHAYLLEAIQRLARAGVPCTLVLVGEGPLRQELEARAATTGQDVRFLGQRRDVPALLARADVVALPSLTEGLSNALTEAMAAGCPIVVTDAGGNAEAVGETGLLVPPRDPAALASALERLLTDDELARRLGRAATNRARLEFSAEVLIEKHVALYQERLARCAE